MSGIAFLNTGDGLMSLLGTALLMEAGFDGMNPRIDREGRSVYFDDESEFDDMPLLMDREGRLVYFDDDDEPVHFDDDDEPVHFDDDDEPVHFPFHSTFPRRTRTVTVGNPILDIGLDWVSVNPAPKYVEMLALAYFDCKRDGLKVLIPSKYHREEITSGILTALREQEKSEKIVIPATYHSNNPECVNKIYTECVLDACRTIFEENQYF